MSLVSTVRQLRRARGLSQAELAELVGVSRQALSAVESEKQVPSTALALRLARALDCCVEDLFQLPPSSVVQAVLADLPNRPSGHRVVVGRVGDVLVAHPIHDPRKPADGLVLEARGAHVRVEPLSQGVRQRIFVAGCAPLLGLLAERFNEQQKQFTATWVPANSENSLDLLRRGLVHVAGVHLATVDDDTAHRDAARVALGARGASVTNLTCWNQGWIVAPGNPLGVGAVANLREGLIVARREAGSGSQRMLRELLLSAQTELQWGPTARDHDEVARMVQWHAADAGVAIEAVAHAQGLDFVPLSHERFDLIAPADFVDEAPFVDLLQVMSSAGFRREAASFTGYDMSRTGAQTMVVP